MELLRHLSIEEPADLNVTAEALKGLLEQRLGYYGLDHWTVCFVDSASSRVTVSPSQRQVRVAEGARFNQEDLKRLFVHEIDTHILRAENGARQPYYKVLASGLHGYIETEEGLALLNEDLTGTLDQDTIRIIALRVLAVAWSQKLSFHDTYRQLVRFVQPQTAYNMTLRVKRGLRDTSQPGGFPKDYTYFSGWLKLKEYHKAGGDLRQLYVGKIGLRDLPSISVLLSKALIKPATYVPEYHSR